MKNAKATASGVGAGILAALALVVAAPAGAANDPVYAGLTTDATVYQSGDDGLWHQVDNAAMAGHVPTWYGSLPGTIGFSLSGKPAPAPAAASEPKKGYVLAGLLKEGIVFVASNADTLWHPIDAATRTKLGLDANTVTWYGSLPGSTGLSVVAP